MFEFNATVSDIEIVPENARSLYTANEEGTGFNLDKDLAGRLDTSKLTGALDKERGLNRQSAAILKSWKGLGFETPEDAETAIEEMRNAQAAGADGKLDFDKWKLDSETKMNKTLALKDEEVDAANATVRNYLVNSQAASILADKAAGLSGAAALIMPHVTREVEAIKGEDGTYVVRVKDMETPGQYRSNGEGGFMNLQELLTEMKSRPDMARAFDAEQKQGTGTKTNQTRTPLKTTGERSPNQKITDGLNAKRR